MQGAILTRVASSHLRVGTFQFVATRKKENELKTLVNYTINRHYPNIKQSKNQALDLLKVKRVDHGVRCLEDEELVTRLVKERVPLTVCPLSNFKLRVFDRLEDHNLKKLLDLGLVATINSDDPSYFGGYMHDNFYKTAKSLNLNREELKTLAKNSFEASFLNESEKNKYIEVINSLE